MSRPRTTPDGENYPGSERERERFGSIPIVAAEMASHFSVSGETLPFFPFVSWSAAHGFHYPEEMATLLASCGSAAEAYFLRALADRGATFSDQGASYRGHTLRVQTPCAKYRLDITLTSPTFTLAVEIDGIGFHHRSAEQVAADYLRERRIVAMGYTVIRFTAQEAFGNASECWRQIDLILDSRKVV